MKDIKVRSYAPAVQFHPTEVADWCAEKQRLADIEKNYKNAFRRPKVVASAPLPTFYSNSYNYTELNNHEAETAKLLGDESGELQDVPVSQDAMEWAELLAQDDEDIAASVVEKCL